MSTKKILSRKKISNAGVEVNSTPFPPGISRQWRGLQWTGRAIPSLMGAPCCHSFCFSKMSWISFDLSQKAGKRLSWISISIFPIFKLCFNFKNLCVPKLIFGTNWFSVGHQFENFDTCWSRLAHGMGFRIISLNGLVWCGGPRGAVCAGDRLCSSLHTEEEESTIRKVKHKV